MRRWSSRRHGRDPAALIASLRSSSRRATAEILRVISSSPTDVQPFFRAVARSAAGYRGRVPKAESRMDGGGGRHGFASSGRRPVARARTGPGRARFRAAAGDVLAPPIHIRDLLADRGLRAAGRRGHHGPGHRTGPGRPRAAGGRRLGAIASAAKAGRSRTGKSSCCRPSPTRRSSPSRTSACSTRRKKGWSGRRRPGNSAGDREFADRGCSPCSTRSSSVRGGLRGESAATAFGVDGELVPPGRSGTLALTRRPEFLRGLFPMPPEPARGSARLGNPRGRRSSRSRTIE